MHWNIYTKAAQISFYMFRHSLATIITESSLY